MSPGVWQLFEETDIAGNDEEIVTPESGGDHQRVVGSRILRDNEQRGIRGDVVGASCLDVPAPIPQRPIGRGGEALCSAQPVEREADF